MGARRKPWKPSGTPFQQNQRVRSIEKQLRSAAKRLRARADRVEWLASKIEANRLAGKPITQDLLWRVVIDGEHEGRYYVAKLADAENYVTERDLIDMIWRSKPSAHVDAPPAAGAEASPTPAPRLDALSEATAIARSSAGVDGFVWTREPLTERERLVRERWIEEHLKTTLGCILISGTARGIQLGRTAMASDLAAALKKAEERMDSAQRANEQREFQRIADELDGRDEPDDESDDT